MTTTHEAGAAVPAHTDADLISRSEDQPDFFAVLFDRYAADVHRYLARRVGSAADDLLSETFLAAFRQRDKYIAMHESARPWLYGIATNLLRRHVRAELRRYRWIERSAGDERLEGLFEDSAVNRVDADSARGALARALAHLKTPDRDALLLFAWAELTYQEIAEALRVPLGTVRSRLNRARRLMRDALAEDGLTIEETS